MLRQTLLVILGGVFAGAVLSAVLARGLSAVIGGMLYGVKATDIFAFSAGAVWLIGISLVAAFLPARRAARVDPMVALRYD